MKSFAKYISKYLMSFAAFVILLLFTNFLSFGLTFYSAIAKDYGDTSPQNMLKKAAAASTINGTTDEIKALLRENGIWAVFLSPDGKTAWSVDAPGELPSNYTIQDVAVFSKGYLEDYPVFVWDDGDGLLVLGYPKDSYTKLMSNYFSIEAIQKMPVFFTVLLIFDFLLLFAVFYLSKHRIIKSTGPIIASIQTLAEGKPASLSTQGELSEVADSVNKASLILSRQNEARANWISGVSHDIRTPLSVIMGYAGRIIADNTAGSTVREKAAVIQKQSTKIKELVQDLNLVSNLEYEMQPLHREPVRLSRLLRSYLAELLNSGIPDGYTVDIEVPPDAEMAELNCDARLISRAVNNLVQNSIGHNPKGCDIKLSIDCTDTTISLIVADNGVGLTPEKMKELKERPHYMESMDERLDLRHGLGLLLVRQITEVHNGTMTIESGPMQGYRAILEFQK